MAKIWITVGVGQNLCRSCIASDLTLYAEAFCFVLSNVLLALVILTILESGKQANKVFLAASEISAWFWVNLFIGRVSTNYQQKSFLFWDWVIINVRKTQTKTNNCGSKQRSSLRILPMIFRDAIIAGFLSFRPSEVLPRSDTSSAWNFCVP